MSYSRWGSRGSGFWYTYWCVPPDGVKETKDNAIFVICTVTQFTAKELRENMDICIQKVAILVSDLECSSLPELRIYMKEFLIDVNEKEFIK